jgi:energy-coupling factor transporter ATP-binding protein EcfA2
MAMIDYFWLLQKYTMPTSLYQQRAAQYRQQSAGLARLCSTLSTARLLCFIAAASSGIAYWKYNHWWWLVLALTLLAVFFILIKWHDRKHRQTIFVSSLAIVNERESAFLQEGKKYYHAGSEYIQPHHPYSYDIDLFGEQGFFHFLNRSTSLFGNRQLASTLTQPDLATIEQRQQSIAELKEKLDYRHRLAAHGLDHPVSQADLDQMGEWLQMPNALYGKPVWRVLLLAAPAAFLITLAAYLLGWPTGGSIASYLFLFNLLLLGQFYRTFTKHLSISGNLSQSLLQLAEQLNVVEKESFNSGLLQQLQQKLSDGHTGAAASIKKLATLFSSLDSISNLPASMALNGTVLFHLHVFYRIEQWKTLHRQRLFTWLDCLGEAEALSSLSNFAYNNPSFVFPQRSETEEIVAEAMGHPLINATQRIHNSISLRQEKFIVLTGSNMSGKSTFLRTLALNMVLARAGSVVCASQFIFYPYDIFVSMRISDSLLDNESFFYAELKRLQSIVHHVQAGHKTFVLLDEILRGTNSNDKHSGTVGLIQKLAAMRVCGLIATHDVTIGALSDQYPGYMANKCFEAQIIHDELLFDYKLKEGICQKLSASFLMKKMGIIG